MWSGDGSHGGGGMEGMVVVACDFCNGFGGAWRQCTMMELMVIVVVMEVVKVVVLDGGGEGRTCW